MTSDLAYDVAGEGPAVVLLHAAVADRRIWREQVELLASRYTVLAPDLRGFGDSPYTWDPWSPADDVAALLDDLGIDAAAVVGNSYGAGVALRLAVEHPSRVTRLMLVGAGLSDHDWSEEMQRFDAREEELMGAGDVDALVELNADGWALPHVRDELRPMIRRGFENYFAALERGEPPSPRPLEPALPQRLGEVRVPALVVIGTEDFPDFRPMGERLERELPDARLVAIEGAGHLPGLERPEEFNRLLDAWLSDDASRPVGSDGRTGRARTS